MQQYWIISCTFTYMFYIFTFYLRACFLLSILRSCLPSFLLLLHYLESDCRGSSLSRDSQSSLVLVISCCLSGETTGCSQATWGCVFTPEASSPSFLFTADHCRCCTDLPFSLALHLFLTREQDSKRVPPQTWKGQTTFFRSRQHTKYFIRNKYIGQGFIFSFLRSCHWYRSELKFKLTLYYIILYTR